MQLEIHDKKLEKIIKDPNRMIKKIGIDMARIVKKRMNEIAASPNFKEYIDYGLGKPHALVGNLDRLYGINLNKNYRLIVEPLAKKLDDKSLKECKKVNIKGVMDYHDGKLQWLIP